MFKDDVCVDLSGVLYGKPNYANVPFSKLFVGPCVDRPEVMAEGPDHVTTLLSEFCASVSCPPYVGALWSCSGQGIGLREGKPSSKAF